MKKLMLLLTIYAFISFFCVGCKKTNNEASPAPESSSQDTSETSEVPNESADDLIIRPGIGVGKIKIGMTVKQMKDILGKPDVAATGISYMYRDLGIEIVAKDSLTINAILCGNPTGKSQPMIKAMEEACKFKTVEGIGIGSTEDQVLKAFGEPTKRSNNSLRYKAERMAISLDNGKVIGIWVQ